MISKLFKSAVSIGIFILLLKILPYVAVFVIGIAVFGISVWYSIKLVKNFKTFIYNLSTKKDATIKTDTFNGKVDNNESINYDDSVIVDVDYEKVD